MAIEKNDGTTLVLSPSHVHERAISLVYGPSFIDELTQLAAAKAVYDVIIVDASESGFLFPAEILIDAARQAKKLLAVGGVLVFVKIDRAIIFVKELLMGQLSFHSFDTHEQLFDYSPSLAKYVHSILGDSDKLLQESTDLSTQVLMSITPVLTPFGIKLKAGIESGRRRNQVLALIDNYTPLNAIAQRSVDVGTMTHDQLMEELHSLEKAKAIFPIFAKIPFLINCFRNKIPFKLKDFLLSAHLVTHEQLEELVLEQQKGISKLSIGVLCVVKGYFTARQLEIALQDVAFYGQGGEPEKIAIASNAGETNQVQSQQFGYLGTTDPAGVLQTLFITRESGVLSVEHKDLHFRAAFDQGRLTHAKLGKMKGNDAVIEFVSFWTEGIYVFGQRTPPADLADDSCKLSKVTDVLLMDAVLAKDKLIAALNKLPKGINTSLEKLPDSKGLFRSETMVDLQEKKPLADHDLDVMQRMWSELDGLTPLGQSIRNLGDIPTWEAAIAIERLLHYELIEVATNNVSIPLAKFQMIINAIGNKIEFERNLAFLRVSLQKVQGHSVRARMFFIGSAGEIGVDLTAARATGLSLSLVVKQINDWQVKYIEYVSQEVDHDILRDIVYQAHSIKKA